MTSERVQRQVDRLLDEAENASAGRDWDRVRELCEHALTLDPENRDAQALLAAARRGLGQQIAPEGRDRSEGQHPSERPSAGTGGTPAVPNADVAASVPPLPEGEGWGEGQPKRNDHPERPSAGAGESPALPDVDPTPAGTGLEPARPEAEPTPTVPTSFVNGRYLVRRFLGEGGKKRVFLAHDTLLDRDVAFALIKTDGLDAAGRDRITREAQAMGRLGTHPHIVSVFDLGEEPLGVSGAEPPSRRLGGGHSSKTINQPYIVTELMAGGDVEGLIDRATDHRPPLDLSLRLAIEVCRGLEFAHDHGIVHRDLKPGNVWLTEATGNGEPATGTAAGSPLPAAAPVAKLGDFGLAVALDRSRLTQAGMMVGTVAYMPPEQALGSEVTPRSDLYSLGAMLYELVTGRPPFVGDESVAIITQHLNTPPVAPSWHRPDCPPALETLILRLLEKDPNKRPASASEVRGALESVRAAGAMNRAPTEGEPVGAGLKPARPGEPPDAQAAPANPMYRRTFVGREPELRQLQSGYDAATSGQGSLAVVVGEPGIGKTSLTEQLATYATIRGGKTLVGHCYEEGSLSLPYLPFVEAMRSYVLAREPDGLRKDLASGAANVARIVSEVRERLHVEPAPANVADADEERYRLFQSITAFLRNASTVQPLVIVLEDLHDADRGSLDLLVHLARNLAGTRLLLVATYRDVEVDRAHPLSGALAELRRGSNVSRVLLRGLTADEVQRMMSQLSGQDVPWRLAEAVHRQTEGNPLFIQEVLRYLVEEGLIKREDGRWRRASEDTPLDLGIPEGLRDVIGKRLSRLSDRANQVLAVAAVMGREFRLDVLQRVAGIDEEPLYEALAEAKAVAVVEERSSLGATVTYRFTHAFLRQTLYEETIAPRRIRLHQQVARALEAVYGRRLDEHAAELAEHYAYSSDPADLAKAVEYGELAAQRALSVYAYGEAERHLEQALKVQEVLDPDDKIKRCDLLLALGETMLPGEEPARLVEAAAEPAFSLAQPLNDQSRMARSVILALEGLDSLRYRDPVGRVEGSDRWIERAQTLSAPDPVGSILIDAHIGVYHIGATSPRIGHPYLRRAARAALGSGDPKAFVRAASLGLRQLQATQDRDLAQEIATAVVQRPQQSARSGELGECLIYLGLTLLERGDRGGAEQARQRLRDLAERTRDSRVRVNARLSVMFVAYLDGRLEDSADLSLEVQSLGAELGSFAAAPQACLAQSLILLGRLQEALALPFIREPTGRFLAALAAWCRAYAGEIGEVPVFWAPFGDLGDASDETSSAFLSHL